ncbi:MAG: hypothetical protein RLP02_10575 [Coleofasciculus sp. C2-GNP5-27]
MTSTHDSADKISTVLPEQETKLPSIDHPNQRLKAILTWIGFGGIWSFWSISALGTFFALQVLLDISGGGVIGKYKLDIFGFKVPTKTLVSTIFAGAIEVGGLGMSWLNRKPKSDELD